MITSSSNHHVKKVAQLQKKGKVRDEEDCFVAEGLKMVLEAPRDKICQIYLAASFYEEHGIPDQIKGIPTEVVEDRLFSQMSDTKTPQGIMCLVRQYHYSLDDMLRRKDALILVLEDLQDPGNVGTIFRTAEGAGADGIILSGGCVDIYHPKTIRATMGSIYRMPFLRTKSMNDAIKEIKSRGICTYAADLEGKNFYDEEDYKKGTAFFIGNEGKGLGADLIREADIRIKIPMEGRLESLNAAVAAALLVYECHRQRKQ
ncbi:MAG: TrmH family RNA methyltransferase [Ruminococcus sp.]|jgi:TrmH family RNA methyltransferase